MVSEPLPFVTVRQNKDGKRRYYWQRRRDRKPIRLPDDSVERLIEVRRLVGATSPRGTVAHVIDKYRGSDAYAKLAPASRRAYRPWLEHFERTIGDTPIAAVDRPAVVALRERLQDKPGRQGHAISTLKNLFKTAIDLGLGKHNPTLRAGLKSAPPRHQVWGDDDIAAFLDSCDHAGARLGFQLLLFTAQRPGDVVALPWSAYDGDTIKLRQRKTGKLLAVPCHSTLKAALDSTRRVGPLIVTGRGGRPLTRDRLEWICLRVRRAIGREDLQLRDLRRTAIVAMAEAGATVPQIASVSGHSIDRTAAIMKIHLPTNTVMARAAILKFETRDGNKE